jgi:hypothetical protein
MTLAQAKQALAEANNTIFQLRRDAGPFKRQRREGYNNYCREQGNISYRQEQQGVARKGVTVPEGAGPGPRKVASPLKTVQLEVKMLRTSRESSDSDEEPECERAYCVRARVSEKDAPPPKKVQVKMLRTSREILMKS